MNKAKQLTLIYQLLCEEERSMSQKSRKDWGEETLYIEGRQAPIAAIIGQALDLNIQIRESWVALS